MSKKLPTRKHSKMLNMIWMHADKDEASVRLYDGEEASLLEDSRVKAKDVSEAQPADPNIEKSGSTSREGSASGTGGSPDIENYEEDQYMEIQDDDFDGIPYGLYRRASLKPPTDIIYECARVYLDLPACVYYYREGQKNCEAQVGGRMVATLTEDEALKLPGVQFCEGIGTSMDLLKIAPSISNVILGQSDVDWKASMHAINKIIPIGAQLYQAQKWFPLMRPTIPQDECVAAWVCVWNRWHERIVTEYIRRYDSNAIIEVTINPNGYKPILSWHDLSPNGEALDRLYNNVMEASLGRGVYFQDNGISLYDQAVVADLLCAEAPLLIKIRLSGVTKSIRPWSNCVRMEAYAGKMPVAAFGSTSPVEGNPGVSKPYSEWLTTNKERLMNSSQYLQSIMRVSTRLQMTEACTVGYWISSQLTGGQGISEKGHFYFAAPLTGLCIGADLTIPRPCFPPPLAYLFTTRNMSNVPSAPAVLGQFQVGKDRLLVSSVGWNCVHYMGAKPLPISV
ncbi:hypothetical protein GCK32_007539 [Trichostrongylus colubriformis]|uniref:Uncharacterized protein n=1 Tax=Trichostrongylus colubriformis TaxID=6319 RepID=A0AAN8EWF4_TRICO